MIHRWSLNDFLAKFTFWTKMVKMEFCRWTSAHCAFFTAAKAILYSGFVSFFEQKIQGLWRTHFSFFKDYIQCKKRALSLCLFLVLPHQEVFVFAPFPFQFSLNYWVSIEIQGLISSTYCNFQGLSRPLISILKFKGFRGFSRCVRTLYI